MLRPEIVQALQNKTDPERRHDLAQEILRIFWPNHWVYWIDGHEDYKQITHKFGMKYDHFDHIMIVQTEEDSFYRYQIRPLRRQIAQNPKWTKKSFIITNSAKDRAISRDFVQIIHKPGILDLIAYQPYAPFKVNFDLKYHTSFLYYYDRPGRKDVASLVKQSGSFSAYKFQTEQIINIDCNIEKEKMQDAPFIDIKTDYQFTKDTAFIIAMETLNNLSGAKQARFSPTLSEKTFKAMHLMRPALIFGGTGTRDRLRELGFDTWDWFIDWTFDHVDNKQKSFLLFKKEIERLLSTDIKNLEKLLRDNKKFLIHNRKQIFKLVNNYRD